jgi:hypothetical protein
MRRPVAALPADDGPHIERVAVSLAVAIDLRNCFCSCNAVEGLIVPGIDLPARVIQRTARG